MALVSGNKPNKYCSIGLLAHVDAGKTTLSEGLLYAAGNGAGGQAGCVS